MTKIGSHSGNDLIQRELDDSLRSHPLEHGYQIPETFFNNRFQGNPGFVAQGRNRRFAEGRHLLQYDLQFDLSRFSLSPTLVSASSAH